MKRLESIESEIGMVFVLDGKEYKTKKAVVDAVRKELDTHYIGEAFTSALMSDLIAGHHYHCSRQGIRPEEFRKGKNKGYRTGYVLEGLFPGIGWHGVSYRKCIYPQSGETMMIDALRRSVNGLVLAAKKAECEGCGARDKLEVHHEHPPFKELATKALQAYNQADIDAYDSFDWLKQEEFTLPSDSGAAQALAKMHETAILKTLCKACHRKAHHA